MQQSLPISDTLNAGDRVVDKEDEDEEASSMRVINANVGPANEITLEGNVLSEYPGNTDYPEDDPVVEVVFENSLNSRINGWKDELGRIRDVLEEFRSEWGVDVETYYFPQSRLAVIEDPVSV
jgi:hypothetical protein